ncbi:phage tail protein [Pseudomonas multiresinivorans]|uniref:Phage tail protein n=1 Tax=Pseudomonas multiresinivorans TaxID=95301 RepID=A0A7Z3GTS9_9PSED|nr:phage tail protein [Pseudomonas multiresinivorans]
MAIGSASASTSMTADEVIVEASLGGVRYCLANQSKTINISTIGLGGMDTGSAPLSGFVGIYLIYNPTTTTSALLGVNATASVLPLIYGGANMPAGYTASALISVWPTNGSGQFVTGVQLDREIGITTTTVLNTSTVQASLTSFSASAGMPRNAVTCRGDFTIGSSAAGAGATVVLAGSAVELGRVAAGTTSPTGGAVSVVSFPYITVNTAQTLYYRASVSAGTLTLVVGISGYTI